MQGVKNNLLAIRLSLGYKHAQDFAQFLDIGRSNYSQIENNKKQADLKTALKISKKLNMPVNEIFELEE